MKQYKLWISVYTGFKCIDGTMRYIDDAILVTRSEEELIALGATPINDKPEKIEMPEVNITKYGIVHSKEMKNWMQQITEAVNSLKKE